MVEKNFEVKGMACAACAARVKKTVLALSGVSSCEVNLLTGKMAVRFSEKEQSATSISNAVRKIGFEASEILDVLKKSTESKATFSSSIKSSNEKNRLSIRLVVSLIFAVPLFCISMLPMFNVNLPLLNKSNPLVFCLVQFLLLLPVLFVNREILSNGIKTLFAFSPNMNSLITIGVLASVLYGLTTMCRIFMQMESIFLHSLYFDSAAMILTFVTLGKFLEAKAKGKTSEAITKLLNLVPKKSNIVCDGKIVEVPSEEIAVSDIVFLRPGETVPVDGIIVEGVSDFDTSAITGESIPETKNENAQVISGSINLTSSVKIKASKVGSETTLSQIIKMVEKASSSKPEIAKLADKISLYFVPVVILIATLTLVVQFFLTKDFAQSFSLSVSVLVVACPCALGLATPTAVMVAIGRAANLGILVKDSQAIENFRNISALVFDKTGTLTDGKLFLEKVEIIDKNFSEDEILQIAGSVEFYSKHPVAKAIVNKMQEKNFQPFSVVDFQELAGKGVVGKLAMSDFNFSKNILSIIGTEIYIGNEKILTDLNIENIDCTNKKNSQTRMYLIVDKKIIAIFFAKDKLKNESAKLISVFEKHNVKTFMLTGDNYETAEHIAKQLNLTNFKANLLPHEKQIALAEIKKETKGLVGFVGDGINDSPSLASSDIGIAIGAGSDIAIESADVVLSSDNLLAVADFFELSFATMRTIKQNLFWALFYNSLCIPIAAGLFVNFGLKMNPSFAAFAMSLSSVTVTLNALRLKLFKKENKK